MKLLSLKIFGLVLLAGTLACSSDVQTNNGDGGNDSGNDAGVDGDASGDSGPICEGDVNPNCTPCFTDGQCGTDKHCGPLDACLDNCGAGGTACPDGLVCSGTRCVEPCAEVEVTLTPIIPDVMLLIDRSGSMDECFIQNDGDPCESSNDPAGISRWDSVRIALTDDTLNPPTDETVGVVTDLEASVRFAVALYDNSGTCPDLFYPGDPAVTDPLFNNRDAIDTLLGDNSPTGDTPTGESINEVRPIMEAWTPPVGKPQGPKILIVATDGEPDTCTQPNPNEGQSVSETAVVDAFTAGIETFILSVGDDVGASHLQCMANAGQGQPLYTLADGPDVGTDGDCEALAVPYVATDPDQLSTALAEIIGGARSCELDLDKNIILDTAPDATVIMNGDPLTWNVDWVMVDNNTMELLGDACDTFLGTDDVVFSAVFPCGSILE